MAMCKLGSAHWLGGIGYHLVKRLKAEGHWVRAVDVKFPEYQLSAADEFERCGEMVSRPDRLRTSTIALKG